MDLGKLTGRTLDLPKTTTLFVVDFKAKKLLLKEQIENSTIDPQQSLRIEAALKSLLKEPKKAKKTSKSA